MTGEQIRVCGIVLNAISIGEYDKRITILTKELGKVQAFVRGAKRPNSRFSAVANPFVFGSFELYAGRNAYNLAGVSISNYFDSLKNDLDAIYYGSYFLELADYFGRENIEAMQQLNLIYISLTALGDERFSKELVRFIYELKTLVINGEYPDLYSCVICGKKEELLGFSLQRRGCVCRNCLSQTAAEPLLTSSLYAMQYVISSPIDKLFRFKLSDEVEENLKRIMKGLMKRSVDRPLKSMAFLE
jgi:DNA repair protein RecO (recombination protein O)